MYPGIRIPGEEWKKIVPFTIPMEDDEDEEPQEPGLGKDLKVETLETQDFIPFRKEPLTPTTPLYEPQATIIHAVDSGNQTDFTTCKHSDPGMLRED